MTTYDYRALCAELTEFVARLTKHYYEPAELLTRARAALADGPAVPEGREPASVTGQPSDGEVAELTGQLIEAANGAAAMGWDKHAQSILRAAELLEQQAPVAVSERPWEREGWCDPDGLCWLGSDALLTCG